MDYFKETKELAYDVLPKLKVLQELIDRMEDNISRDDLSADDGLIYQSLLGFNYKISSAFWDLEYLQKPVIAEGSVHQNSSGRFEIDGTNHYFTSGSPIEVYVYDDIDEVHRWVLTRVEHSDSKGGYYAVGVDQPLWSCKVRVR